MSFVSTVILIRLLAVASLVYHAIALPARLWSFLSDTETLIRQATRLPALNPRWVTAYLGDHLAWPIGVTLTYICLTRAPAIARRLHRDLRDRCTSCGYPLQGLPSPTCPECGHPRASDTPRSPA